MTNEKKKTANEANIFDLKKTIPSLHNESLCSHAMHVKIRSIFSPKCGTDTVTWLFELTSKVATFERSKLVGLKSSTIEQ